MADLLYPGLDVAIGKAEGYGKPGTIPTLAYNPGDIIAGPFATKMGATGSLTAANGQQIAVFPSEAAGYAATDANVAAHGGGSITDLASSWLAGSPAEDQANWANTVSSLLGVDPSATVASAGAAPSTSPASSGGDVVDSIKSGVSGLTSFALFGPGVSWGRAAGFILGLITLAGAIYLFKPAQEAINTTIRAGRTAAAAAA